MPSAERAITSKIITALDNVHARGVQHNTIAVERSSTLGNNIVNALGLGLQHASVRQEPEVVEARGDPIVEARDPSPTNGRTDSERDPSPTNGGTDSERDPSPTNGRNIEDDSTRNIEDDSTRDIEDDNNHQNFRTKRRRQSNGYHRCGGYDNSSGWKEVLDDHLDPKKIGWNVAYGTREALTEIFNVLRKHHNSIKGKDDQAAHDFCWIVKNHINENFHQKRLQTSVERKLVEEAIHSVADAMFGQGDERMPLKSLDHVKQLVSNNFDYLYACSL